MLVTETELLQICTEISVGKKIDLKIASASLPIRIKQMILNLLVCVLHPAPLFLACGDNCNSD